MGRIFNWLKNTHKPGDPSRLVPSTADANRIANILQDIVGVGCRIDKPINNDGYGWRIIIDGSSDGDYPVGYEPPWPGSRQQFEASVGPTTLGVPSARVYAGYHMIPYGAYGWLPAGDYEDIPITGTGWIITRQAKSGPGAVDVVLQGTQANPASTTNYESDVCYVIYTAGAIEIKYASAGERNFVATV